MTNIIKFSTAEICAVAGVKVETLRVWRHRGIYALGSGEGHKKFTITEVYQTSVIVALQTIGLSFEEAYSFATSSKLLKAISSSHKVSPSVDNLSELKEKTYIGVCRYLSDMDHTRYETGVEIFSSNEVEYLDQLFNPVIPALGGKRLPVISICMVQLESIMVNCFASLKTKIEQHLEGGTSG